MKLRFFRVVALAALICGCRRAPVDATPEGAVRGFVEAMARSDGNGGSAKEAYALLSASSRATLQERAQRYTNASGKKIEPEAMIVPSRPWRRFTPQRYTSRAQGDRALVEVVGADPAKERTVLACVREDGAWRLELNLPPPPTVEHGPR